MIQAYRQDESEPEGEAWLEEILSSEQEQKEEMKRKPVAEILSAYRGQYQIERAFRRMKDPQHIALRPQYHWTDQKIRVHVFTCVLALTLLSLLRRDLHHRGFPLSIPRMVDLLAGIREMVMFFPPEGKHTELRARIALSKMSPEQRDLFDALDLERYTSV